MSAVSGREHNCSLRSPRPTGAACGRCRPTPRPSPPVGSRPEDRSGMPVNLRASCSVRLVIDGHSPVRVSCSRAAPFGGPAVKVVGVLVHHSPDDGRDRGGHLRPQLTTRPASARAGPVQLWISVATGNGTWRSGGSRTCSPGCRGRRGCRPRAGFPVVQARYSLACRMTAPSRVRVVSDSSWKSRQLVEPGHAHVEEIFTIGGRRRPRGPVRRP